VARAAVVTGLGAWLPPRVVTNDDLSAHLDTSDEWIRTRTGIRQRHIADRGTACGDLAVEAGSRAMKSAGLSGVGAVVLATTTPDRLCPATAPDVAARLGLAGTPAFDLSAACSGFVYGLAVAAGLIGVGAARDVLLIGAEMLSTLTDPDDRSTRVLFGDGAGAVVLRAGDPGEPGALGPIDLGSDGNYRDLITVPGGGSAQRSSDPDATHSRYITLQGKPVFRWAVERMSASAGTALGRAGWTAADVDCFVAHQANVRIVTAVGERLGIPTDRRAVNIDRVGNTSAASIPLALTDAVADGLLRPGHRVLLSAFGGGFTWGSTCLVWPDLSVY
jgi:3-oxoacyl-[acyl-carrier-protein] synthase-3